MRIILSPEEVTKAIELYLCNTTQIETADIKAMFLEDGLEVGDHRICAIEIVIEQK